MSEQKIFFHNTSDGWTELGEGNRRRVLLHTDELMVVEFAFEQNGIGAMHNHPHVQASYVAEGRFEVTVGDRTETLAAGDSFIVPSNIMHGVRALTAGRLVDSFTPHRADFLA